MNEYPHSSSYIPIENLLKKQSGQTHTMIIGLGVFEAQLVWQNTLAHLSKETIRRIEFHINPYLENYDYLTLWSEADHTYSDTNKTIVCIIPRALETQLKTKLKRDFARQSYESIKLEFLCI